jgi:hypothetical protein
MPNRFIPLAPGSEQDALVMAINRNFAELDNESVVKTFNGPNGKPALVFGKLPNGKYGLIIYEGTTARVLIGQSPDDTYGIWVSKEGEDVLGAFS